MQVASMLRVACLQIARRTTTTFIELRIKEGVIRPLS